MATPEELAANPDDRFKVLAETRGEGGYVVVAPTGGTCHPTGDTWSVASGKLGKIPTITWEQRCALVEAFHAALDEMPTQEITRTRPHPASLLPARSDRPGDDFNARAEWQDILGPHGWRVHRRTTKEVYWTRPGKDKADGWSATTGYSDSGDRLYVWSSSTVFEPEKPYDKFSAYALLEHNGNFANAARALAAQGYGKPATSSAVVVAGTTTPASYRYEVVPMSVPETATVTTFTITPAPVAARPVGLYQQKTWMEEWAEPAVLPKAFVLEEPTYHGFSRIFSGVFEDTFKYIPERKAWAYFDGRVWRHDSGNRAEAGAGGGMAGALNWCAAP